VLKFLVTPWKFSNRVVCADSYFASVPAARQLLNWGLKFIGVVKTATRMFPMKYLSEIELAERGDRKGIVANDTHGNVQLLAFVWMDRDRRYFIASGSSLQEGTPYIRDRWRQVGDDNALPERVRLVVPQPKAAEVYYNCCARVDQHNRDRQSTLMIENKLVTHDWAMRVNLSILAMCMVDTWRVYKRLTCRDDDRADIAFETQKEFYGHLAAELIDNNFDNVGGQRRRRNADDSAYDCAVIDSRTGEARSGIDIHLTPTKLKRKDKHGNFTNKTFQGRCRVCSEKTTHQCSQCRDESTDPSWICHTSKGKMCFPTHLTKVHNM
jgi:hypothetical protein